MKMALNQQLVLGQILTPQLILNLKLLQVSTLELEALVRQELEENPALEQADDITEQAEAADELVLPDDQMEVEDEPPAIAASGADEPADAGEPADAAGGELRPGEGDRTPDPTPTDEFSINDLFPDDAALPNLPSTSSSDKMSDALELAAGPEPSLREALMPGLRSVLSEEDAATAAAVFDALNEDGLLAVSEEELAEKERVEPARLREILYVIQRLESGGIACRDVPHAFAVQLEVQGFAPDSLEMQLVTMYWELLLQKKVDRIARMSGTSEDEVRSAVARILTLEPKPARRFFGGNTEYVSPDFNVTWRDGRLVPVANDESFPRLRLARRYAEILRNPRAYSREQVKYAREKLARALMFLRGIESRRRTLARLMEIVVADQHDFFIRGPEHLKPATLKEAAERLNVHPSTASRAIAGKYVETDYGIFAMKHFFLAGTKDKSRASIKERVKQIVESEDPDHPLSDDEIAVKLTTEGTTVARRTVAKYRGELGIPGYNQRRRF